jgi:hypothetical protein
MKLSMSAKNRFLSDPSLRKRMIRQSTLSSAAVEDIHVRLPARENLSLKNPKYKALKSSQ